MSTAAFVYFDLGNVLLHFDHSIACREMAALAGLDPLVVQRLVFESGLELQYERGDISSEQFYEQFCVQTGTRPDFVALQHAASDIFQVNTSIVPIVDQLRRAGRRLGVLSNTCECHWEFCLKQYELIREPFEIHALSYRLNRLKPEPEIYLRAAQLAGVEPEEIFFTDDRPDNVAAACQAGFDAILYDSSTQLAAELHARRLLV